MSGPPELPSLMAALVWMSVMLWPPLLRRVRLTIPKPSQLVPHIKPILVLFLPVSYRLRFSTFCLVDAPRAGAMHAMHTSRVLLRRNCWKLFRLDLHFWWYHGLLAVASLIQMLPLMGFVLPVGSDATYYLCNGVYLAIVFGLYAAFRNRIECTYAAAYDALREKPKANSVVLGNIFDM